MDISNLETNAIPHRHHLWVSNSLKIILLLLFIFLASCQTQEPEATPTPTRTPIIPTATPTLIPTSTPTATPTNTPIPTPTLPPNLALPPEPSRLSDWSDLPADLFFLRNGRINIWLAEGTHIEIPLLSEDNDASVQSYRVIPGGRYITYITTTGKLYKLDRATWQHIHIPTSGYLIENNDVLYGTNKTGDIVYYVAWGTQPSTASSPTSATPSGTILATNTLYPQSKQSVIGFCQGAYDIPCLDLSLSPDESQIAYSDGLGVWLTPTNESRPSLVMTHSNQFIYSRLTWSPDGRWLLLTSPSSHTVLMSTSVVESQPQMLTVCEGDCTFAPVWTANMLWFIKKEANQTCLIGLDPGTYSVDSTQNQNNTVKTICQVNAQELHLVALQILQDNRVSFIQQGCEPPCNGLAPGIYTLNDDESIIPVALIDRVSGKMVWTQDGSAFLYVGETDDVKYLGLLDKRAYLDVTDLLRNATDFQWAERIPAGESFILRLPL